MEEAFYTYTAIEYNNDRFYFYYRMKGCPNSSREHLRHFINYILQHPRPDCDISKIAIETEIEW